MVDDVGVFSKWMDDDTDGGSDWLYLVTVFNLFAVSVLILFNWFTSVILVSRFTHYLDYLYWVV